MNTNYVVSLPLALAAFVSFGEITWEGDGPDYSFGSLESPLPTDSLAAPKDVDVRSLSLWPDVGAVVTVTGGPLAFRANGTMAVTERGAARVVAPVMGAGDLLFSGGLVFVDDLYPSGSMASIVMMGVGVGQIDVISAELKTYGTVMRAHPCHDVSTDEGRTLQLQVIDGSWLKCAKVRLVGDSGNVAVQFVYGRYAKTDFFPIGTDFDTIAVGDVNKGEAAQYTDAKGLELKGLTVMRDEGLHGTFVNGTLDVGGGVSIETDANVGFDAGGTADGSGTIDSDFAINGRLSISNRERTEFTGTLSGSGVLAIEPWQGAVAETVKLGDESSNTDLIGQSSVRLKTDFSLSSVTNVSDVWIRMYQNGPQTQATVCQFANNGGEATFQAQIYDPPNIKCAIIRLYQSGNDLAGEIVATPWYNDPDGGAFLGRDMYEVEDSWTGRSGKYYPNTMTLHVWDGTSCREVVLSKASAQTAGRIEVGANTRLVLNAANCLPAVGVLTVQGGGEAETAVSADVATGESVSINVMPGGVFRQKTNDAFAFKGPRFNVDGGELALKRGNTVSTTDCGAYLNRVTLSGGARVTGLRARIGSNLADFDPAWYVRRGSSGESVKITSGFNFVGQGKYRSFVVSVDDFAEGADLVTCPGSLATEGDGAFAEFGGNSNNRMNLCKRGKGTWLVGASSPGFHAAVHVEDGELALAANDALAEAEEVSLDGGSLSVTNGTEQTIRKLAVTVDSALNIGAGTSVSIVSMPNSAWSGKLAVTGAFNDGESPLRIGETACLSARQLRMIRINGHRAAQDENGYLHPADPGIMIIFR